MATEKDDIVDMYISVECQACYVEFDLSWSECHSAGPAYCPFCGGELDRENDEGDGDGE